MTRCIKKPKMIDSGKMNSLALRLQTLIEKDFPDLDQRMDKVFFTLPALEGEEMEKAIEDFQELDIYIGKEYEDIILTANTWLQSGEITDLQADYLKSIANDFLDVRQDIINKYGIYQKETA